MAARVPPVSKRAARADPAIIDRVLAEHMRPGVTNLAVGLAHWAPPPNLLSGPPVDSRYGDCHGDPALLDVLRSKLSHENGIDMQGREVMVTPGANQAFVHALLAVCDNADEVAIVAPYYMAHYVAIQARALLPITSLITLCAHLWPLALFSQLLGLEPVTLSSLEELGPALARPESRIRACVFCLVR
jgi:hypothetical protein